MNETGCDHPPIARRVVGGMLDVFWLGGPSLEAVVRQYHTLVGRPLLPPAWALGFHQSRWGYRSVEALEAAVRGYAAAAIPLDTIWSDIDHMDGFRVFTLDRTAFAAPRMQAFLRRLHAAGRKWVPIVDPGVKIDPGYPAYDAGVAEGLFLRGVDERPYVGKVRCPMQHMLCVLRRFVAAGDGRHWWHTPSATEEPETDASAE